MITYEDCIDDINDLLKKSRDKWQLDSISWMGYDDVAQIIRLHILEKWHMWDQARPFKPWCRSVIQHQILNQIRNNYSSFCRPCLKCPFNLGGDFCSFNKSGLQDDSCEPFKKWHGKKFYIYNLKFACNLEEKVVTDLFSNTIDVNYERSAAKLHEKVMIKLKNEKHLSIYKMLYIDEMNDDEVAKIMGFLPDGDKVNSRYKQLNNIKKKFLEIAKEVMQEEDII